MSMIDADIKFQKDQGSHGSLPRIEEDDSIGPLPNPSSFFNRGSQAIINDEDRSATFGNSSANSGFNHPLEIQQQLS